MNVEKRYRSGLTVFAIAVLPVVALVMAELLLRVAGSGQTTAFASRKTVDGTAYQVVNTAFYQQFLSMPVGNILDLDYLGFQVPCKKAENAYRIFIFGDSAVHGCTPDAAFGVGRMLELMLARALPDKHVEIYNAACPALNSHVMRLAARACERFEPDLFVVYMGNNEFIGPFGPGIAGDHAVSGLFIDFWAMTRNWRLVQLFWAAGGGKLTPGAGSANLENYLAAYKRYPADAPARAHMRLDYANNLRAICDSARIAGARAILCTVQSNLRDWAPFESQHRAGLSQEDLENWDRLYAQGEAAEQAGKAEEAVEAYRQAAAIDDTHAGLDYRLGVALGDHKQAVDWLKRARDNDALPMRVDGKMNYSVLQVAAERAPQCVTFADVEQTLGIGGREMLWDFVHFNFHGNYLFASALYHAVLDAMKVSPAPTPPSEDECATLLGYTKATLLTHVEKMLPAFQFWGVPDNQTAWLEQRKAELTAELGGQARQIELDGCAKAVEANRDDYAARVRYGQMLLAQGSHAAALEQGRKAIALQPARRGGYLLAASAADAAGRKDDAMAFLRTLQRLYPDAPPDLMHLRAK